VSQGDASIALTTADGLNAAHDPTGRMTRRRLGPEPTTLYDLQVDSARWQAVLGTMRDAIIAIDPDGRVTLFNAIAEQVFGYPADEVLGQNVSLLMPPPYRDEHDEYLRRYRRTGEARAIGRIRTVQGRRKNGDVFPIELSVSEAHLGEQVLYTAIVRDISDRLAIEAALRFERDFAERLIETAQMIVLVLDPAGRIERYNAYLEQVSGRAAADARGADWFTTFVPEREREHMRSLWTDAVATGPRKQVSPIVTAGGDERQIEWSSKLLNDGGGHRIGLLCTGEDITDRLAAQYRIDELQLAAQERTRLADIGAITAKVVHDLGNPLAALSMQAQLILRRARRGDFAPVAPVREPTEQILRTLRRLDSLVHEFTDFSRDQRLELRPIAVAAFLASCVDLWHALAAERHIALSLAPVGQLPPLRADEVMLRRVLDNLIKNAIEAVEHGPGEVVIAAAIPSPGKLCLTVEDSGPGIPEGLDVFKLFETTKPEGTGIGLAVARQLIAAHGGLIEHTSRSPCGTTFRIELPLQGPAPASRHGSAA
jgi:two-component system, LuxR family, sensor kinase FixL